MSKIVVGALLFVVVLKARLERELAGGLVGVGIGCDRGDLGSVWNRDLRCIDWRGGRGGAPRLLVGLGGVGSGEMVGSELLGILRLLKTHFWISDVGDNASACGGSKLDSHLFRVCIDVLERISPLNPSSALCLLFF